MAGANNPIQDALQQIAGMDPNVATSQVESQLISLARLALQKPTTAGMKKALNRILSWDEPRFAINKNSERIFAVARKALGAKKKGFQAPLLRSAGMISMPDLDSYDSELTQDLLALHDEIAMNPVRGYTPDYRSPHAQKRVWNFTWNSLQNRLVPAISKALPQLSGRARDSVKIQLESAIREMTMAQSTLDREENYSYAGVKLEGAFSLLHDAIEIIREATRKAPAARSIQPPVPQAYKDFS
jgi:hypothetical protein